MKKLLLVVSLVVLVLFGWSSVSHAVVQGCSGNYNFIDCWTGTMSDQNLSNNVNAGTLLAILVNIGGFLIVAAGVIAAIVIVVAGLLYMTAGSNTARAAAAKTVFKNGVIGALILFASGLIVNTIILLATDWQRFFS